MLLLIKDTAAKTIFQWIYLLLFGQIVNFADFIHFRKLSGLALGVFRYFFIL